MDYLATTLGGAFVALTILCAVQKSFEINISDDELYRFCIVRNIELQDCKIPPMPHIGKIKEIK